MGGSFVESVVYFLVSGFSITSHTHTHKVVSRLLVDVGKFAPQRNKKSVEGWLRVFSEGVCSS